MSHKGSRSRITDQEADRKAWEQIWGRNANASTEHAIKDVCEPIGVMPTWAIVPETTGHDSLAKQTTNSEKPF